MRSQSQYNAALQPTNNNNNDNNSSIIDRWLGILIVNYCDIPFDIIIIISTAVVLCDIQLKKKKT